MPKPTLPQGTRDFNAETVRKRNYIFNTIRTVFELYGFEPLETPAMENSETLMGKYGDEGDKLIFKILNSGNFLSNIRLRKETIEQANIWKEQVVGSEVPLDHVINHSELGRTISERALRYDLTVPFARYVV